MSVSTAGASANLKTETLMSLQDVINKLESPDNCDSSNSKNVSSGDDQPSLDHSIKAAKACLLSYIELQSQFSYNSWKALSQLSKVLKADSNMADVVTNIKTHFSFNEPQLQVQVQSADTSAAAKMANFDKKSRERNANSKQMSKLAANRQTSSRHEQDSYGLEDAINLLSLASKKSKKTSRRSKIPSATRTRTSNRKSATFDVRSKSFDKRCLEGDLFQDSGRQMEMNVLKQSTWPGKANNNCTSDRASYYNDWSLWPANMQDTTISSTPHAPCVPFRPETFQDSWNAFALNNNDQHKNSTPSCSVSASASGSLSGGSNSSVGMPSTVGYLQLRQKIAPKIENSAMKNNTSVNLFGSLNNFLDCDSSEVIAGAAKRISHRSSDALSGDTGVHLPSFAFNEPSSSMSTVPLDVRIAKTSTWPLKQTSSSTGSSNWAAFSPIPFDTGEDAFGCGGLSSTQQQQQRSENLLISGTSIWPAFNLRPKMQPDFTLFEANNNTINKNY